MTNAARLAGSRRRPGCGRADGVQVPAKRPQYEFEALRSIMCVTPLQLRLLRRSQVLLRRLREWRFRVVTNEALPDAHGLFALATAVVGAGCFQECRGA